MSVLTGQDLTIGYRKRVVAEDLSLELCAGELVCLLGPNGAGKSTLVRTLAGMQPPLAGRVLLQGDDVGHLPVRELAKRLSVVLTERVDAGTITARELVALGRYPYTDWMSRQTDADRRAVAWALRAVGAAELADRPVHELSDGERQKIMIARALAQEPAVILLDEPTAFLDLPRRVEIVYLLRALARETRRAILISTHDLDLALRSADQVWLLAMGGKMHVGAPEDLVLSGAFGQAFASMGAHFDAETGTFATGAPHIGTVRLLGQGIAAQWTARALEREGFRLDAMSGDVVEVEGAGLRWRVTMDGNTTEYETIYDMLAFLKSHNRNREPVYER
jgi:iron complex transport system ATP-binding protein